LRFYITLLKQKTINQMKKFLTAMSIILGLGSATAQQVAPATKTTTTKAVKPAKAVETKAAKPAQKLKKDGTPDKRYKENQKLKKDGTPDKRYKVNK
jgi:ribosomal protein S13